MTDVIPAPFQTKVFKPVVGGIRHLTRHYRKPMAGFVVEFLCGDQYQVGLNQQRHAKADCLACYQQRMRQVNNGR